MRFTIKTKIASGFGAVLILAGAAGTIGYMRLASGRDDMADNARMSRMATLSQSIRASVAERGSLNRAMVIETDVPAMLAIQAQAQQRIAATDQALNELDGMIRSDDVRARFAELKATIAEMGAIGSKVREQTLLNSNVIAMQLALSQGRPATSALRDAVDALSKVAGEKNNDQAASEISNFARWSERFWGEVQGTIGAPDMPSLRAREAEDVKSRQSLIEARDSLVKTFQSNGISTDAFTKSFDAWLAVMDKVLAINTAAGNIVAGSLASGDYTKKIDAVMVAATSLATTLADMQTERTVASTERATQAMMVMAIVLGAALLAGLGIAGTLCVSISRGLNRAVHLADGVARGDLSQTADVTSQDEVGDLIVSLNAMTKNLNATAALADCIAAGDLTVEPKPLSDKDRLGIALESMVGKLRLVVADTMRAAEHVSSGSQELSASAEQLSQGSTEQASSTEEASASMEEMAANVKQNAGNASQTETIARRSAQDAEASGAAVNRAVDAMQVIASKITIVQEIARQTDLLALNAAVEAARAGEHGRGFAVVASEVRKLAERSQAAAAEIGTLSVDTVKTAQDAGAMLTRLVPDIRRTAELVEEITAACREQDVGAVQINQAIQQLDKVTQQNASAAEQVSGTSEELAAQAEQLQAAMSFFRIDTLHRNAGVPSANPVAALRARVAEGAPALRNHPAAKTRAPRKAAAATGGFTLDMTGAEDTRDDAFRRIA